MSIKRTFENIIEKGINVQTGYISYVLEYTPTNYEECINCSPYEALLYYHKQYLKMFLPISNILNAILSKIFINEQDVWIAFFDFADIKQTIQIKADIFQKSIENQMTTFEYLVKNYNYNSDYGCLIYGQSEDWAYFYGEDLHDALNTLANWQSFHLLLVHEREKPIIDSYFSKKFSIKKNTHRSLGKHDFGDNFFRLEPIL
jgi:hypothetical protein